ncbi:MAG: PilZ domain-containing protein [Desulfobacteraceae bacterium]|nr:PilZ domain-containing protein [Desulfobacteraceae bacterium]
MDGESKKRSNTTKTNLRKEFRFPVQDRDDCWVIIENKKYPLSDLSYSGIGISVQSEVAFQIGESFGDVLTDCTLNVMECIISGMNCKIAHISPATNDLMVCGLSWLNPRPEMQQLLVSAIQRLKAEDFNENNSKNK